MHSNEININESLVRLLINTQFSQWAHLPVKAVKSAGTDNTLYRLGDEMVVRLPRIYSASRQIDKEQYWLPKLAPFLPLAIPNPLAAGVPAEKYPWHFSVYQWLIGEDASIKSIVDMDQAAIDLAEFLLALHQIDPMHGPSFGEHNFFRGEPLVVRDKSTRAAITSLHHLFDAKIMIKVWNCSLEAAWNDSPCWIHGDLIPTNLLVQNDRLSAVIDFGGLGVGDSACDLIVAWSFLTAKTRETFRTTMAVDDNTWIRGRGWALTIGLIAFDYYQETNPILAGIAKRLIEEVVADYKVNS